MSLIDSQHCGPALRSKVALVTGAVQSLGRAIAYAIGDKGAIEPERRLRDMRSCNGQE